MSNHPAPLHPSMTGDTLDDLADESFDPTALATGDVDADLAAESDRWTTNLAADGFTARVEDEMRPLLDSLQRLRRRGLLD